MNLVAVLGIAHTPGVTLGELGRLGARGPSVVVTVPKLDEVGLDTRRRPANACAVVVSFDALQVQQALNHWQPSPEQAAVSCVICRCRFTGGWEPTGMLRMAAQAACRIRKKGNRCNLARETLAAGIVNV